MVEDKNWYKLFTKRYDVYLDPPDWSDPAQMSKVLLDSACGTMTQIGDENDDVLIVIVSRVRPF